MHGISLYERTIDMRNNENRYSSFTAVRTLTESALLIAVASVLSIFALFKLPNGGSVTIGSMIPIILISMKYPLDWSLTAAFVYSLIQMIQGFYPPPVENIYYYTLMVLLDYVVAFSVLCLAGPLYRKFSKIWSARVSMMTAAISCFVLRFICHFLSGIIIWGYYAGENQPVWLYSLLYNGSYMLCECLISGVILLLAGQMLAVIFLGKKDIR